MGDFVWLIVAFALYNIFMSSFRKGKQKNEKGTVTQPRQSVPQSMPVPQRQSVPVGSERTAETQAEYKRRLQKQYAERVAAKKQQKVSKAPVYTSYEDLPLTGEGGTVFSDAGADSAGDAGPSVSVKLFSEETLISGIVMAEVLGKPKSMRNTNRFIGF